MNSATDVLEPLTEFISQDKPVDELRDTMLQQMDVFLQAETLGFIDILFQVVESKVKLNIA